MSERDDHSLLSAGYELGAETPEEAAQFADVSAQLGLSLEPIAPPPSLKADLMAKIAVTPQLPAEVSAPGGPAAVESEAIEPPHAGPVPVGPLPAVLTPAAPVEINQGTGPAATKARSRWFARPGAIIAAAAAAAVLIFGGTFVGTTIANNSTTHQEASGISQITSASDAQRATTTIPTGGKATLVWSDSLGKSAIELTGLASAPDGKTYQAWYIRDGKAVSAGTFDVHSAGSTTQLLSGSMSVGDKVAVTVEPAGGSKEPTTLPILAIAS